IGYGLNVPSYNKTKELVIGPLVASTYIGGKSADAILSLATDASGNVYAAGNTRSLDFPTTTEAYDASYNGGSDAFIVKLTATMTNIISCTYLGGSAEESLRSMAVDAEGNVYVAGYTWSTDFPTSAGALCRTFRGGNIDAFISRFDATLATLIASTYLGGGSEDYGYSLVLDPNGNVYLAGRTLSANFPTTEGAYDVSRSGYGDVFTSKINGYLSNIIASTLLGGTSDDIARCVTVDAQGNVYVAGETASSDFPITCNSYDTSYNGEIDGFVSKLKGDLTGLLASTFLGGSSEDGISAILKHTDGGVYVSGRTASADFPTTILAYDTVHGGGGYDAFVSKLSGDLASLPASTFLGGVSLDRCRTIIADAQGDICVAGETASSNFPTTPDAYDISYNGGDCDAFLSKFNGPLTGLLSSTFLGGSGYDYASCITTDKDGYLCVVGYTKSPDFPVTANTCNTVYKSDDAFVSKVLNKATSARHGEKGGHNR
ncbi:MAG: SBBP repeat-containing protein, partial [Planctomycetes bacterium]|nr:SBBP repeat-containing protein [Planctomycetota bacterium]